MRRPSPLLALSLTTAALAGSASAETITACAKGCDYTSINAAIAVASDGDVIQLAAETYREATVININHKTLTIRGILDPDGTPLSIVDGQDSQRVIRCESGALTIQRLIIERGRANPRDPDGGGGLLAMSTKLFMDECTVRSCRGPGGAGIRLIDSDAQISNSMIFANSTEGFDPSQGGDGGGVLITNGTTTLDGCYLSNFARNGSGGSILATEALMLSITNCEISGLSCIYNWDTGEEICQETGLGASGTMQIIESDIRGVGLDGEGTIEDCVLTESISIRGMDMASCTVSGSSGFNEGPCSCCFTGQGGIAIISDGLVRDCIFTKCSAYNTSPMTATNSVFTGCIFDQNSSDSIGYNHGVSPITAIGCSFETCTFRDNRGVFGGAIGAESSSFTECLFVDNEAVYSGACDNPIPGVGGAVSGNECSFSGCLFLNNLAAGNGQAISGNLLNITDSFFCNEDGDWISGEWTDGGGNQFAQACDESNCQGDIDGDGEVGGTDLGLYLIYAGRSCEPTDPCPGDLDGDGEVRGSDLGLLLANWGPCP